MKIVVGQAKAHEHNGRAQVAAGRVLDDNRARLAILIADGVDEADVEAMKSALTAQGGLTAQVVPVRSEARQENPRSDSPQRIREAIRRRPARGTPPRPRVRRPRSAAPCAARPFASPRAQRDRTRRRWHRANPTARHAADEPLAELETDKASVEVPSPASGVLRIQTQEGETVRVYRNGRPVADIVPVRTAIPAWKKPPRTRLSLGSLSLGDEVLADRDEKR